MCEVALGRRKKRKSNGEIPIGRPKVCDSDETVHMAVRIPKTYKDALTGIANNFGVSPSVLVRSIIELYLETELPGIVKR